MTRLLSQCNKKDEEIQALREGIDSDRREPDTAEHLDTSQRAPAEAPDEIDAMRKKIQDLRSEIVGLKNQLTSSRSSDNALQHQGREPASQLVSKSEKIQQLHEELQVLRDKHRQDMLDEKYEIEGSQEDLAMETSKVCDLRQERKRLEEKVDNIHA